MEISSVTKRCFRRTALLCSVLFLVTVVFINGNTRAEDKSKQVAGETVVVEVNGAKFTQKELDEKIDRTIASVQGMVPPEQLGQFRGNLKDKLVEDFVTRTLISEQIEKNKIKADDAEVAKAMEEVKGKVPPGMTLEEMLKQGGITVEELKENITFSLRANKLFETQVQTDYIPTDAEIQKYYDDNKKKFDTPETVHARHILIKIDEKDDDKVKAEKKKKIEARPKKEDWYYAKRTVHLEKDTAFRILDSYYDQMGRNQKEIFIQWKPIEGSKLDMEWLLEVTDLRGGHSTIIPLDKVQFDTGMSERFFTERTLMRTKW